MAPSFVKGSMSLFWDEMDEAGVDIGVVVGRNSPEIFLGRPFPAAYVPNEHVAELQDKYPERLVGFAGIDVSSQVHDAVAETKRAICSLGLKGIFVEPGRVLGTHAADERAWATYEACIELNVPVVFMSGPYAGADINATHPVYFDQVATRYPELKMVIGHGAWPWVNEIIAVAFKHPNVYVSPDVYLFMPGADDYVKAANLPLIDQMLFGTAYPGWPMLQCVQDCMELPLNHEAREKFMSGNAARLLGIPTVSYEA